MRESQQEYDRVTVDMRALIDNILARYSGKFTVFRELLQNSDDAGCDTAEIRFETTTFLSRGPEAEMNIGACHDLPLANLEVAQWTFRNHGKPFTKEDWDRLPRIAWGNPDPQKVGAFGVGFYSVFSVTEAPYVASGGKEMELSWNDKNQLCYQSRDSPAMATRDLWTTFKLPLRKAAPMPPISEFIQFLASSITFMRHLKAVAVFFDHHCVGQINMSLGQSRAIHNIPNDLKWRSPRENMVVKSVQQRPITIEARTAFPQHSSTQMHETKVDLNVFTAEVDVTVGEELSLALNRCMKKDPPSRLQCSLIFTKKNQYDCSCVDGRNHPCEFPSPFQGLCADLDGATHTRIFIGHATAQTTGIGGHIASHFIPTMERESIDLVNGSIAIWNTELLYIGGLLCRVVYESELSRIQTLWDEAAAGESHSCLPRKLLDQFNERFLHVLKFFTFRPSTPLSEVSQLLAESFFGCSLYPLRLLSSVGVREAPEVRAFDPVSAKFLKSLPMLSRSVMQDGRDFIAALPDKHKIPTTTLSDILGDLRCQTLNVEELIECLRWWIGRADTTSNVTSLFEVVTLCSTGGAIRLSSITHFIDREILGVHIPPDGPLPPSLIPLDVSKCFSREELTDFGWREFTIISWLQYISPNVTPVDKEYDFTQSVDWASRVLSTVSCIWPKLHEDAQGEVKEAFRNGPCIPTSKGLRCPECSYLPIVDNTLFYRFDLPIAGCNSGLKMDENMKTFFLFIGVRKDLPVQLLLDRMMVTEEWTAIDLLNYLVRKELSPTPKDLSILTSSRVFMQEGSKNNGEENTRHRADELYPPMDIFRILRLPVIRWSTELEWKDSLPQVQLLYRLGLNRFPPLQKIVELCSSSNVHVQETAFIYLCENLHSQYSGYEAKEFCNVEFIPAESKNCTCLKKLEDVYSCTQWKELGLFVTQDRYRSAPFDRLGIPQHPSVGRLLGLLEKTPPPDRETARRWFEVLFNHITSFLPSDLKKLSTYQIVPTGPSSLPKLLCPVECYIIQGARPKLYEKLFAFVDFGTKANYFLCACGSKSEVSKEDIAKVLAENPERFFKLAGGYKGFLIELRELAHHINEISNEMLYLISQKRSLLGVHRKKTKSHAGWEYGYQFLTYQEVIIVDDIDDYQLFSDHLFVAPQEEAIEQFYARLGCSCLTAVVTEECDGLHEITATSICSMVQSLVFQRLPLIIEQCTDAPHNVVILCSPDHLKVKACKRILVSKTLVRGGVKRTREVWAFAKHQGDCKELWISETGKQDMYEVATSLCRLLFGKIKMNTAMLIEMILSADPEALERRGFLVDKFLQKHRDGYGVENKVTTMRLAGSVSTIDSPHRPALDIQPVLQLRHEELPGSSEATLQFRSLPNTADHVSQNIRSTLNASIDQPLNAIGHSAVHLPSQTSDEVISQNDIRKNVEKAIRTSRRGGEESATHMGRSQFLCSTFCRTPADIGSLRPIGKVKNIEVCVDEGMLDADTFMERMHAPLARFVGIIIFLSGVYHIPTTRLQVFYDIPGGCIAFNCRGTIYLNLRYFEVWHDEQVRSGNQQPAQISWFLVLAHEIAHNLTHLHDADHEFWFAAICEAYLIALSQHLKPANATRPHVVMCSSHIIVVVLLACFAICIALVANILG